MLWIPPVIIPIIFFLISAPRFPATALLANLIKLFVVHVIFFWYISQLYWHLHSLVEFLQISHFKVAYSTAIFHCLVFILWWIALGPSDISSFVLMSYSKSSIRFSLRTIQLIFFVVIWLFLSERSLFSSVPQIILLKSNVLIASTSVNHRFFS